MIQLLQKKWTDSSQFRGKKEKEKEKKENNPYAITINLLGYSDKAVKGVPGPETRV